MLDIKEIINNSDFYISKLKTRNTDYSQNINEIKKLSKERVKLLNEIENFQAKKNSIAKDVAYKKQNKITVDIKEIGKNLEKLNQESKNLKAALNDVENNISNIMLELPNVPHGTVKVGKDENDNKIIETFNSIPKFDFIPLPHWELLKKNNMIDLDLATKITGTRFALFKNDGAKLLRKLINLFLDNNINYGYKEIKPSCIVNKNCLKNTGQFPKFMSEVFQLSDLEYYLSPTSEVQLTNLYINKIFKHDELPIRNTSHTNCFRKEAGAAGKDTRGIIRLHEFNKVEIISVCKHEEQEAEFNKMIETVSNLLNKLNLAFRIVMLCTGDLGFSSKKTYDFEVWFPHQKCYREVSSCSICGDFQARRGSIKYLDRNNQKQFCNTLNASSLAVERIIAALVENNQDKDGNINLDYLLN